MDHIRHSVFVQHPEMVKAHTEIIAIRRDNIRTAIITIDIIIITIMGKTLHENIKFTIKRTMLYANALFQAVHMVVSHNNSKRRVILMTLLHE